MLGLFVKNWFGKICALSDVDDYLKTRGRCYDDHDLSVFLRDAGMLRTGVIVRLPSGVRETVLIVRGMTISEIKLTPNVEIRDMLIACWNANHV